MASLAIFFAVLAFCFTSVIAAPLFSLEYWFLWPSRSVTLSVDHKGAIEPGLETNFADPSFLQANASTWVAFATSGRGKHIQVATASDPLGKWNLLDDDALPGDGWTTGENFWAPDVRKLDNGTFIMYFAGRLPDAGTHCIGAARSHGSALGPYVMDSGPFICPIKQGGAIDPMGFKDSKTGRRYVAYKIDGNKEGGDPDTPLLLQEVDTDGTTPIGDPVTIMERIEDDGPLIEAPDIVLLPSGMYLLFFSSHMFSDAKYDIKYAYAKNVQGPYVRAPGPLLSAPHFNLTGPGGATSNEEGNMMVFHGLCGGTKRCMYAAEYKVNETSWFDIEIPQED